MNSAHDMPFGAIPRSQGGARFRLWAPGARSVALVIDTGSGERVLDAPPDAAGWAERIVEDAGAGVRYRWRIDGTLDVPDPASRFNPDDVFGASELIDPNAFRWPDHDWRGRPWHEAVIYELHVGAFTEAGTYAAAAQRLPWLRDLGITVIELMPIADFPGRRGWGYDGVLPFAPDSAYGRPEELKAFVAQAHGLGLAVMLDVVYNHFGPAGNWLGSYAPAFFDEREHTPWGAAIGFAGSAATTVRDYFVHNALYWLHEYRFDGLRLDAVHAIRDRSDEHVLEEIARRVRASLPPDRHVHLVLENERNEARWLGAGRFDAQWNDDFHHAAHVIATGERDGYYADYARAPVRLLGRCLAEGFAWQGEPSPLRGGAPRGEPSHALGPLAFVDFLQNHDQIGNRAFGERLAALAPPARHRALAAILLLAPSVPLLFMGDERGATTPFLYFCDHAGPLAAAITEGRRREFEGFGPFADPALRATIPDPGAVSTFESSRLDWVSIDEPPAADWIDWHRRLLRLRRGAIVPLLPALAADGHRHQTLGDDALVVDWRLRDGGLLKLAANFGAVPLRIPAPPTPGAHVVHVEGGFDANPATLDPDSVVVWHETTSVDDTGQGRIGVAAPGGVSTGGSG